MSEVSTVLFKDVLVEGHMSKIIAPSNIECLLPMASCV